MRKLRVVANSDERHIRRHPLTSDRIRPRIVRRSVNVECRYPNEQGPRQQPDCRRQSPCRALRRAWSLRRWPRALPSGERLRTRVLGLPIHGRRPVAENGPRRPSTPSASLRPGACHRRPGSRCGTASTRSRSQKRNAPAKKARGREGDDVLAMRQRLYQAPIASGWKNDKHAAQWDSTFNETKRGKRKYSRPTRRHQ